MRKYLLTTAEMLQHDMAEMETTKYDIVKNIPEYKLLVMTALLKKIGAKNKMSINAEHVLEEAEAKAAEAEKLMPKAENTVTLDEVTIEPLPSSPHADPILNEVDAKKKN